MKIFAHARLGGLRVSRNALRHYALYRRCALLRDDAYFTLEKIEEFHVYEATGVLPFGKTTQDYRKANGYANGKWVLQGPTQEAQLADLASGLFCKADFYRGPTAWYYKNQYTYVAAGVFFPFDRRSGE